MSDRAFAVTSTVIGALIVVVLCLAAFGGVTP